MKLGRPVRLFNLIKTTENNDADSVMGFPLCCFNYCLLTENTAGLNVLMLPGAQAAGDEIYNRQTWLGNRSRVSRGFTR